MQQAKENEEVTEEMLMMQIEVLDEDLLLLEDTFEQIENEIRDKAELHKIEKKLEYFSNKLIVYSFVYREHIIFQTFDRSEELSEFSYLADVKMHKSHLLNLINRGESFGNRKNYIR